MPLSRTQIIFCALCLQKFWFNFYMSFIDTYLEVFRGFISDGKEHNKNIFCLARGFAPRPCCMAGTIEFFFLREKTFILMKNIFTVPAMQHGRRPNSTFYYSTVAPFYHIRGKERAKYATLLHCRTGQKYGLKAERQNGRTKLYFLVE